MPHRTPWRLKRYRAWIRLSDPERFEETIAVLEDRTPYGGNPGCTCHGRYFKVFKTERSGQDEAVLYIEYGVHGNNRQDVEKRLARRLQRRAGLITDFVVKSID